MLKRIVSLLLALSLLSGPAALAGLFPDKPHRPVDYAEMLPVTPFEEDALQSALKELEGACSRHSPDRSGKAARQRVSGLYNQVLSEMNELITKLNLASVQYDAAGGAEDAAALYRELSAQQTRLYDQCYQVFAVMAASPYADLLDSSAGEGAAESLLGYEGLTDALSALYEEEDRLIQAYDQILSKGVPVQAAGGLWTADTLQSAEVDANTYQAVSEALAAERNRAAGEVYRQLVRLRTQIAAQAGYASYADYAYEALYTRDYSLEDAKRLRDAAKRDILPLQLRLPLSSQDLRALSIRSRQGGEEVLDLIQPFIEDFDREMGEAFAFMREHHLYDIEYGESKLSTGYTVSLPAYGSAFIFNSPYGDYQDLSDTVHEFGHFFQIFRGTQHDLWADFNIDVGEIDSQALELLFTGQATGIFGEQYGKVYENAVLYNLLDAILDGCLYDEFQAAAYENPEMSVEELDRLFKELSEEYGYSYDDGVESDPSWVENVHTFRQPMYFISYATSALSALDLWFLYLDSPRQGREVYLDLSALSLSLPYRAAVEAVGLRDIFEPETIPALAEELEAHLDGKDIPRAGGPDSGVLLAVFGVSALAAVLWLRSRPSRRKRAEVRRREALDPWSAQDKKPPWEL